MGPTRTISCASDPNPCSCIQSCVQYGQTTTPSQRHGHKPLHNLPLHKLMGPVKTVSPPQRSSGHGSTHSKSLLTSTHLWSQHKVSYTHASSAHGFTPPLPAHEKTHWKFPTQADHCMHSAQVSRWGDHPNRLHPRMVDSAITFRYGGLL